jgi:hypothetical protein
MNPTELFHADGRSAGVFFCGECKLIYRSGELELAENCCKPWKCDTCGAPTEKYWTACRECRAKVQRDKDQAQWEKAEKVLAKDWDGPVWNTADDSYHPDLGDLIDDWVCDHERGEPLPHVYVCDADTMKFDAERMIEHALEEHYEDASDDISQAAHEELQQALDAWTDKHGVTSYHPDYKRAVIWEVDPAMWPDDEPEPDSEEQEEP